MLQRLIPLFVGETERNLLALRAGVESADAEAVRALAHKMKSGCLAVGATWLASRARRMNGSRPAEPRPVRILMPLPRPGRPANRFSCGRS
jgi:hypothetical protein